MPTNLLKINRAFKIVSGIRLPSSPAHAFFIRYVQNDAAEPVVNIDPPKAELPTPSIDPSLDTILSSAGCDPSDIATGAISPPIYLSTTFERDELLQYPHGFSYSRIGNPTRNLLEKTFTALEKGKESFAFSSGMQSAVAILLSAPGSHILLPDDLYHGVYVILLEVLSKWGLTFEKIDMTNIDLVKEKLSNLKSPEKAKVILWLETPSNPLCKVTDIVRISKLAKSIVPEDQLCIVVDSTWSTPYLLRPLTLGADLVLHSMTKYIGGHSDVMVKRWNLWHDVYFSILSVHLLYLREESWLRVIPSARRAYSLCCD